MVAFDSQLELSVAVVCYHTPESQLARLVESLLIAAEYLMRHQPASVSKLDILDNSELSTISADSFNQHKQALEKLNVKVTFTHGHGNVGYGRAHNIPLKDLCSDYHLILNPDVIISSTALHNALTKFRCDNRIKLLSPNASDCNGRKLFLCKRYPSVLSLAMRGFLPQSLKSLFFKRLSHYEMQDLSEINSTTGIPLISGCFMLAETASLKSIGGFNEKFFLYFEDFDLSIRMSKLGEIVYAPDVKIIHAGGNAAGKGLWHIWKFILSGYHFFKAHDWRWI